VGAAMLARCTLAGAEGSMTAAGEELVLVFPALDFCGFFVPPFVVSSVWPSSSAAAASSFI